MSSTALLGAEGIMSVAPGPTRIGAGARPPAWEPPGGPCVLRGPPPPPSPLPARVGVPSLRHPDGWSMRAPPVAVRLPAMLARGARCRPRRAAGHPQGPRPGHRWRRPRRRAGVEEHVRKHVGGVGPRPSHLVGACHDPDVTDDELADAWEAGVVFPGGVSHLQHLRIAWVLHRRHGPDEARRRLLSGTKRACEVHRCPDKFDASLTDRWSRAIAEAGERDGLGPSADSFIAGHPGLRRGDLFSSSERSD